MRGTVSSMRPPRLALALALAALGVGCGAAAKSPAAAGDGSADGSPAACPHAATLTAPAPACNTVVNAATAVPFTARTGAPPAAAGGAIADGFYQATRAEGYGAATPSGRRLTLVVLDGATRFLWSGDVLDAAGTQTTLTFQADATATPSGTQIALETTCASISPPPLPAAMSYTATGDTLLLAVVSGAGADASVTTYTRTGCQSPAR